MNGIWHRESAFRAGLAALFLVLLATPGAAQTTPAPVPGGDTPVVPTLVVESDPPGAVVILRGAYEWTGLTPWRLYREVSGLYRVEVRLPGYDRWTGEVVLGTGGVGQLRVKLGKKTAAKSFVRSAVIPGWGQAYRGQRFKGALFLAGTAVAAGGLAWTHESYREQVDEFEAAKRAYQQSTRVDDLPARYEAMRRASEDAGLDYDRRQFVLTALASVYALNLLDCIMFAPSGDVSSGGATGRRDAPDGGDPGILQWLAGITPEGSVRGGLHLRWN